MLTKLIRAKVSLALLTAYFLLSCGDPSPWASYSSPEYSDLTERNLDLLTTGQDEFKPFSIALVTDPQVQIGHLKNCKDEINKVDNLAFSLILGDITDRSLRREFEWVADVIREFRRPVLTVVGNHDGLIYGEKIYRNMFGPLNYSFVYNDIKFILWNDNPYEWGKPDLDWLETEVRSHPQVIIIAHQAPGVIERFPEVNDEWKELYKLPNVLGSFHGHTHSFYYQKIFEKPAFTVARVSDTKYAIVHFKEEMKIEIEKCEGSKCTIVEQ